MTPFVGQIMMFAGNYAPNGYAFCNGQTMSISQNSALFSLLGTTYGGNGTSTFLLPNLQSRLPVGQGTGAGLSPYVLGQTAGVDTVTLTPQTMPAHTHALNATKTQGSAATIGNTVLPGTPPAGPANLFFYANQPAGSPALTYFTLAGGVVSIAGSGQPHTNLMPSLCITFVIALVGIFPTRS
jgi:microcystin-dependent protein